MKVLFVLSEYLPDSGGGIITYYAGILPHLVRAGHEVDVLVASREAMDRAPGEIDGVRVSYLRGDLLAAHESGFARFRIEFPSLCAFLPIAWAAYDQCRAGEGYDLVETTDFPMLFAPWMLGEARAPVNVSLHGSPGQIDWHERPAPTLDSDWVRLVEQVALAQAPGLQANSRTNSEFWKKTTRRPVPVLLPSYRTSRWEPARERKSGGLVVGRLQRWKGPHVLCQALELLPGVEVRWIGKDVRDPVLGEACSDQLAREFPQVFGKRLKPVEPMPNEAVRREIATAEFLCVPSTWDVFNLTIVEAMDLGTPVICSTEAGASMLVEDGVNGLLFDPADIPSLVDAIRRIREMSPERREAMAAAARRTVEERLDPERLVQERIQYYRTLTGSPRQPAAADWLKPALSPRRESESAARLLGGFTTADLASGAVRQGLRGVRRKLGMSS